jgi:hypothetical protein
VRALANPVEQATANTVAVLPLRLRSGSRMKSVVGVRASVRTSNNNDNNQYSGPSSSASLRVKDDECCGGASFCKNKQQQRQKPIRGSLHCASQRARCFGRDDRVGVGLRRAVERSSIPHPLQRAQRVGHPEGWRFRLDADFSTQNGGFSWALTETEINLRLISVLVSKP